MKDKSYKVSVEFYTLLNRIVSDTLVTGMVSGSGRPLGCIGCKAGRRAIMLAFKERLLTYGE